MADVIIVRYPGRLDTQVSRKPEIIETPDSYPNIQKIRYSKVKEPSQ
jgi:hypothetical protein